MKQEKRFNVGERIFAKVRGYPPWPAKIENITDPNSKKNAKYHVVFYGTGEIGQCKIEDIYTYADNKSKFSKSVRRKQFHEGILELEKDLENFPNEMLGNISDFQPADNLQESLEDSLEKESESMVEGTSVPFGDSDAEAGALVIDESDKKKNLKRKSSIATPSTPENSALKNKRGKKSISGSSAETPFQAKLNDISQESLDEESEKKVSRSGRKIKPKRFHDSDAEITPDSQKIVLEQSKSKSKTKDEGTEIKEASISPPIKKRISGEKDDKKYAKEDTSTKSQSRTKILRIEAQLLNWEHDIKASLLLDSANTEKCLEAMEKLLNLDITPLMLKKHPFVVETIKRLRVYIGNLSHWKLSPEETQIFNEKALLIQKKAEEIYDKFRKLFEIPPTQSFWELFMKEVEQFKSATKEMSQSQIFSLIVDPNTSGIKEKSITNSNKVFSENANISKIDSIEEDLAKQLDSDSETK